MKPLKIVCIICFCLLLPLHTVQAAEGQEAENLTAYCHLKAPQHVFVYKTLDDPNTAVMENYLKGQTIRVTWDEQVNPQWLCVQWGATREGILLRQFDKDRHQIAEEEIPAQFNTPLNLIDGACEAELVAGQAGMIPYQIALFGPGTLPDPYHSWLDTPDHLDYLVISTHPDDDLLFMGCVNPVYGASRGYLGTVAFVTAQKRIRVNEAENGVWASGCRYRPIFLGLPDLLNVDEESRRYFNEDVVAQTLVRLYREKKPLVVFTHDLNGEYGNWQHMVVAAAAAKAYKLAADPEYDPASAESYGTWQVQKLYIHMYGEDPLIVEMDTPLDVFQGKTAFQVAQAAYLKHFTQLGRNHKVEGSNDALACNRFGMIAGQVSAGEDAFDNIPESAFNFFLRGIRKAQWLCLSK